MASQGACAALAAQESAAANQQQNKQQSGSMRIVACRNRAIGAAGAAGATEMLLQVGFVCVGGSGCSHFHIIWYLLQAMLLLLLSLQFRRRRLLLPWVLSCCKHYFFASVFRCSTDESVLVASVTLRCCGVSARQ
jgi:hypothetical protein